MSEYGFIKGLLIIVMLLWIIWVALAVIDRNSAQITFAFLSGFLLIIVNTAVDKLDWMSKRYEI